MRNGEQGTGNREQGTDNGGAENEERDTGHGTQGKGARNQARNQGPSTEDGKMKMEKKILHQSSISKSSDTTHSLFCSRSLF